jgi:hypothetical protein
VRKRKEGLLREREMRLCVRGVVRVMEGGRKANNKNNRSEGIPPSLFPVSQHRQLLLAIAWPPVRCDEWNPYKDP